MEGNITEVMLDLETMSTHDNASIVSIGAVKFTLPTIATLGGVVDTFYVNVDLASSQDAGLHVESRTVSWWSQQSEAARAALTIDPVPLVDALHSFTKWFGVENSKPIWANPATFDLTILGNAYKALGLHEPWEFYHERCYMTLRKFFPSLPYIKPDVPHDALQDAIAQTQHLIKMLYLMEPLKGITNIEAMPWKEPESTTMSAPSSEK